MNRAMTTRHLVLAVAALFSSGHEVLSAQTVAITGGTVFPVSAPRIERGTVLIRDGKIVAVGADVAVPPDAQRIDATGKWVTPGLIHAASDAGLGIGSLFQFSEGRLRGDVNPSFSPIEGIDPLALTIAQTRTGGITTAIIPPGGEFIRGRAVTIDLTGESLEEMEVNGSTALVISLDDGSKAAGGGSRAGTLNRLRQLFRDAREYERRKADYNRAQMQALSAPAEELAALLPALQGLMPVYLAANRVLDIQNALRLKAEFKLRLVLQGATEGWVIGKDIAAAGVPVLVQPMTDIPSFDGLRARLDNATLLRDAGVQIIIAQGDAGGDRNLRWVAGNAVRNGLTWDEALQAITATPATVFGLADRGTLEPGKLANLVVWSGDPLDFAGAPERVFIRGKETTLRTRETELFERYRTLPPGR
jgi:imidazolonepropionase-like amidohydrolase